MELFIQMVENLTFFLFIRNLTWFSKRSDFSGNKILFGSDTFFLNFGLCAKENCIVPVGKVDMKKI